MPFNGATAAEEPGPEHKPPGNWLFRLVPAFDSLRTYTLRSFRLDLFAGLTVAAVAIPQAMAYASIPQLPIQYGLYTAIIMTAVGAMLDSSRQLINGPTNAICIALASAIGTFPPEQRLQAAILMAFLVGVFQIGITLFRLGDLTRFISHSVIVGFTLGAAILLVLDQTRNLLGLTRQGSHEDHFLLRFWLTTIQFDQVNYLAVGIGSVTIVLVLLLRALGNRLKFQLPELLMVVALMAVAVWYFDWENKVETIGSKGAIPAHLPALELPAFSWSMIRQLMSSSLAIAVLGLLEAVAMAKAIAARTQQRLDIHQQCLSEGVANFVGSFFQCFPGSGSLTRSAINVQAGAVSQWSGVFAAGAVALTVLFLAPLARFIPFAALAGILFVSAWRLIDQKQLAYYMRTTRFDMLIVVATGLAAIVINIEFCILIGVFLSVALYVQRAAQLHLTELVVTADRLIREWTPTDTRCNRILIYSLEGEMFFGSAPDLEQHLDTITSRLQPASRVIVLRLKRVRNPDAVCMELFGRFIRTMKERGIQVLLCGVRPDLAKVLHTSGVEATLGKEYVFLEQETVMSSTLAAVRHAYDMLRGDYCATCPRRDEGSQGVLYFMI